ncbi:uncharacterized protein [Hyperolius riggenbachi]|uniref:uncharacterized protein n=1 Tax=Hyperolius riggenbachi TaxID=752182 RepID=UPI0035A26ED4
MCPFLSHPRDLNNDIRLPVGGRVAHFYENWESHFQNKWLLNIILEGYKIEFATAPPVQFFLTQTPSDQHLSLALQREIAVLLEKRVIRQVPKCQQFQGYYSPVFLVKKPQGEYRFILNLKGLNRSIRYRKFRMDNIRNVVNLLQSQCYMASIDLKDAYLHLPIHVRSQQYLRFAIRLQGEGKISISLRNAMALLGLLTSSFPAVQWGQLHSRTLQLWILRSWNRSIRDLDRRILIPQFIKDSLNWWLIPSQLTNGRLWSYPSETVITTDASAWGWGAHLGTIPVQGSWPRASRQRSSNNRELAAVWQALTHFDSQIRGTHVTIRTDNNTVVAYLNRQGGTRSHSLWYLSCKILQWAEGHLKSLRAVHLKGTLNCLADFLSRSPLHQDEWSLNEVVFQGLVHLWGRPDMDLFARKNNTKCQMFCSLCPQDNPCSVDAFSITWNSGLMYAYPPPFLNSSSSEQITERPSSDDHDSAILAQKTMVYTTEEFSYSRSCNAARSSRPAVPGSSFSSRSEAPSAFSLEPEWRSLKQKGFSNGLSETLIQSRKKVTRNIYQKTWNVYKGWCEQNSRDCSLSLSVLEFLQEGYQKGLSTSTLKVQTAAISVFLERRLAEEEFFIRFFQALKRIRPLVQSRMPSWDLNTVLQALCNSPFEPLEEISDKCLTIKTAFLVAITSARRVCELQALSMREPYCIISGDRITLRLDTSFLPKVVSKFHRSQEIFLPSFCNNPTNEKEKKLHCLDVRRTVLGYLDRSKQWRKSDALFVLFGGRFKGKQASKSTIARWIRQTIALAYSQQGKLLPSSIKAHSTRAVSASWAEKAGASIEQICRAATWSSQNTFVRHYRLDIAASSDLSFGRKVLQAVVPP